MITVVVLIIAAIGEPMATLIIILHAKLASGNGPAMRQSEILKRWD